MTESTGLDEALDVLYGVALEAFVDERKRLSQNLRRRGDKSAATQIAKWRKPSAAAWALNRMSREEPDLVDEWLAACTELRGASARPTEVGGEAVRAAIAAQRSATSRLLEVMRERALPGGRRMSEDMLDRARTLLQTAATDSRAAELLRRGRIDEAAAETTDLGVPEPEGRQADRATGTRKRRSAADQAATEAKLELEARERAQRRAQLQRRIREAEAEAERLNTARRDRLAAADKAAKRVKAAREALARAEEQAEAAGAAVDALDEPVREARIAVEELRADLESDDE